MFRLQERLPQRSEQGLEMQSVLYDYDAYILYSSADEDRLWVHYKLVPQLEKDYGLRLCIHHRDFVVGPPIIDNIQTAIESSRKVIAIVSPNFLTSDWCIEEVQMTFSMDKNKFIFVIYKDVFMSSSRMPPIVQHLLDTRTYIEWTENEQGQSLFWKQLIRAVYSKNKRNYQLRERDPSDTLLRTNEDIQE